MKVIKTILFIIIITLLIVVIYLKYIKQEPLIKLFGKSCLIVATGSMEPTILSEELIIIDEKVSYKKGDIITYIDEDEFIITHRITEINGETFITKGDANNIKDTPCSINAIQGKVVFHSKILGKLVLYWLKPLCIMYAIGIAVLEISKIKRKEEISET